MEDLLYAVMACIVIFGAYRLTQSLADPFDLRTHFEEQFRQFKIDADDRLYRFDGMDATIAQDREEYAENDRMFLLGIERYARNDAGEYCVFISNGRNKVFAKHVTQRIAKLVLQEKYLPPPCAD